MIDSLRSEIPVRKMWIMMVAGMDDWFPYDDIERLALYPSWSRLDLLHALLNVLTLGKFSYAERCRRFIEAVNEADIVIHAPGGPSVGSLYGGRLAGDFPYVYRLLVAKVLKKKPLFFYAPSMGPFSGRLRNWARKLVLKRADAIVLREDISLEYLRNQLGLEGCVTLDSAFQNDIPEDYLQRYDNLSDTLELLEGKRTVGMVITDLKWHPSYRHSEGLAERIIACCSEVANHLLGKGYPILLIPQLFGADHPFTQREVQLLESFRDLDKKRIHICPSNVDSYGQQVIISKLYALITMRYHPAIFAAKGLTPFISVHYEHKAEGFAEKVGFADYAIDIEHTNASEIINRFALIERDYDELKDSLTSKCHVLKEHSRKTTRIIVDRLTQLGWRIGKDG